jgi:hypothetical protein
VHGHTAAKVVSERADASKPFMGLVHVRPGGVVRKADVGIAKNYLDADGLGTLNRIVNAYLEFAELQAHNRRPMHMADWIAKLDELLRLSEREILDHPGQVSHEQALRKAEEELDKWRAIEDGKPRPVGRAFDEAVAGGRCRFRLSAHRRSRAESPWGPPNRETPGSRPCALRIKPRRPPFQTHPAVV